MKIEHIGLIVAQPMAMAAWYVEHLGLRVRLQTGDNSRGAVFLEDSSGRLFIELGANGVTPPLDFAAVPPLQVHLALKSADPEADARRLQQAGATLVEEHAHRGPGDYLLLLRDPWGVAIQLARRTADSPVTARRARS
jgi:catechol 2,3-dioxygenase-like lactoylglutathione lyase family enzyme